MELELQRASRMEYCIKNQVSYYVTDEDVDLLNNIQIQNNLPYINIYM